MWYYRLLSEVKIQSWKGKDTTLCDKVCQWLATTGTWPMDLNFPVFATGVHIFRASNDVGLLFLGTGSTRILEINAW
jgi:hypothetical protein